MKYYQYKHEQKFLYLYLTFHTIFWGAVAVSALGDGFIYDSRGEKIFGVIFFSLMALSGIVAFISMQITKKFERIVEINQDGIVYYEKKRTIRMNWEEVAMVLLIPRSLSLSCNRVVFFVARGHEFTHYRKTKVSNKKIWSEYNDQMLEEIKKYYHWRIVNEDKYLEYKNKQIRSLEDENREYE